MFCLAMQLIAVSSLAQAYCAALLISQYVEIAGTQSLLVRVRIFGSFGLRSRAEIKRSSPLNSQV